MTQIRGRERADRVSPGSMGETLTAEEPKTWTGTEELPDGGLYEGGFIDVGIGSQRHGAGTRWYKDRKTVAFTGHYKYGRWDGPGKFYAADGRLVYEGEYKNDLQHGRGTWYGGEHEECDKYEGMWAHGKKHGVGTYVSRNGDVRRGQWKDNLATGESQTVDKTGTVLFSGRHERGQMSGHCTVVYEDGSTYDGDFIEGMYDGQGCLKTLDGCVYNGGWKASRRHGHGVYCTSGGYRYEGEWVDGERHGPGRVVGVDRYILEGTFSHNDLEGEGMMKYPNKIIAYEGEFFRSKFHGIGELFNPDGSPIYSGEFCHGQYHGYGNCYYRHGEHYFGYWKHGLRHTGNDVFDPSENGDGEAMERRVGEFRDTQGWLYIGEWVEGVREGVGKVFDEIGKLVFEGTFLQNVVEGHGHHFYSSIMMAGSDYSGPFRHGKKHGRGTLTYRDGTVLYAGDYVDNECHGTGEWQDVHGTWYKGDFRHSERTGRGEMEEPNGNWYSGEFLKGQYHGAGTLVSKSPSKTYTGQWRHGKYLESDAEYQARMEAAAREQAMKQANLLKIQERLRQEKAAKERARRRKDAAAAAMSSWGVDDDVDEEAVAIALAEQGERQRKAREARLEEARRKAEEEVQLAEEREQRRLAKAARAGADQTAKDRNILLVARGERALKNKARPKVKGGALPTDPVSTDAAKVSDTPPAQGSVFVAQKQLPGLNLVVPNVNVLLSQLIEMKNYVKVPVIPRVIFPTKVREAREAARPSNGGHKGKGVRRITRTDNSKAGLGATTIEFPAVNQRRSP